MSKAVKSARKTSFGTHSLPNAIAPDAPTEADTKSLCSLLSEGIPLELASAAVGLPRDVLLAWLRQGQRTTDTADPLVQFAANVARSEARGRIALIRAASGSPAEARKMLERMSPREFSPEVAAKKGIAAAAEGSAETPRSVVALPDVAGSMDDWVSQHAVK